MQLNELYKSTFDKVPFSQESIEQQKNIMRGAAADYIDDTDKEIAAMKFDGRSNLRVIKYVSVAAVLILLFISSALLAPLLNTRSAKFHFVPLPEQSAPPRNLGLIYPEKEEISSSDFTLMTGTSIPEKFGEDYYMQNETAVAYYDSDGNPGMVTCTASYLDPEKQEIIFTASTGMLPLPLGMSAEGNERIEGVDISLSVNEFKNTHYAYFEKSDIHMLIRFESMTQYEVEKVLTLFLSD